MLFRLIKVFVGIRSETFRLTVMLLKLTLSNQLKVNLSWINLIYLPLR